MLSFIINQSFCQEFNNPSKFSKENYLHKKKVSKVIGYSLLGTSVILFATGVDAANKGSESIGVAGFWSYIFGLGSGIISIPFFILGSHYKYKASKFSIKNENAFILQHNILSLTSQPSLSLKISF